MYFGPCSTCVGLTGLETEETCWLDAGITQKRKPMRLVIVESPFAAATPEEIEANINYARQCVRHSLSLGEAPIASHLLYTQPGILRDDVPDERKWGIDAGLAWRHVAEASVVYTDRGISKGMEYGIAAAKAAGKPVEYRSIEPPPVDRLLEVARETAANEAFEAQHFGVGRKVTDADSWTRDGIYWSRRVYGNDPAGADGRFAASFGVQFSGLSDFIVDRWVQLR